MFQELPGWKPGKDTQDAYAPMTTPISHSAFAPKPRKLPLAHLEPDFSDFQRIPRF